MAEFPATGGVMTSSQFKTVKLLHLKGWNYIIRFKNVPFKNVNSMSFNHFILDNFDYFILGTEIVYMLYILYYTGKVLASELASDHLENFKLKSPWNYFKWPSKSRGNHWNQNVENEIFPWFYLEHRWSGLDSNRSILSQF